MTVRTRIIPMLALVTALFAAGAQQAQDKVPLSPVAPLTPLQPQKPDAKAPAGLPALMPSLEKKMNNICPICGKTRSECYDTYEKSKKDPSLASKVCEVWKEDFSTGKTRPYNCPICGWKVFMPLESMRWREVDTDLCPYPFGKIRFTSELVICPRSGFAAFQEDFRQPQPQFVKDWVATNITPMMEGVLRAKLGKQAKVTPDQLYRLYDEQENIPDTVRCSNAYLYYLMRMQRGDAAVKSAGLARVAWMTAWAQRREVGRPIQSGPLMDGVRKISEIIQKQRVETSDVEATIRLLTELYNDKDRFDICERQILRIFQAGYYNRLGLNTWAKTVLQQAQNEAQKKYPDAASDPWMQLKGARNINGADKVAFVDGLRKSLIDDTIVRLNCLTLENTYMAYAGELIITGLKNNEYDPQTIPSFTYLAGEFLRRQELFSRSLLWLDATRQMLSDDMTGLPTLAPMQLDLLKRYVADRNLTPPPAPQAQADWTLLQQLAVRYRAAKPAAPAAPVAPAAPTTPAAPAAPAAPSAGR